MSLLSTARAGSMPPTLPGFGGLSRTWDSKLETVVTKILPGEYYVSEQDELITTVLGSCVSACIRDPNIGVGGMNHFMLPGEEGRSMTWGGAETLVTRFGIAAMEQLINGILKQGGLKARLEVKLFGGGRVLNMGVNNIGDRNIQFARDFLEAENLRVVSEDLGGEQPRKVNYFPRTGRVMVRRLQQAQSRFIADTEQRYAKSLAKPETGGGDIELFG